ncbi:uncharacterized protein LOC118205421 [Stegodyphus dumicola]|uniref:uncharacterized protein LOC118205421 n=1 Tax=Stegodyphus dumicola TaxID=202533 RepID=UPI0015AA16B1|nr:uncharacterized protein LOC118205421 [Stegodyphus dumicola]
MKGKIMKQLYTRAIERLILYGCPIWWHHTKTVRVSNKLLQIQRIVLLSITKAFSTSPTTALQVLVGALPLDLKADQEAKTFILVHFKEVPINTGPISGAEIEEKFDMGTTHPAEARMINWHKELPTGSCVEIFTDGSKTQERVGAAFVVYDNKIEITTQRIRLKDSSSVFQAEAIALISAFIWINDYLKHALKELITTEKTFKTINLNWIRGHIGIDGNEAADQAAKEASNKAEVDCLLPTPILAAKDRILKDAIQSWQERWDNSEAGRQTYEYYPKVSLKRLRTDFPLVMAITNHGKFPSYFKRFLRRNVRCGCGLEAERGDAKHLIFRCPLLSEIRKEHLPGFAERLPSQELFYNSLCAKRIKLMMNYVIKNEDRIIVDT